MSVTLSREPSKFLVDSLYLQHNHDTSLRALAKAIRDKLSQNINAYSLSELDNLDRNNLVGIVNGSLKDDLPKLLTTLDDMELPKILIAKSNGISLPEYKTQLQLNANESVLIKNEDDENDFAYLDGVNFEYSTKAQIIIINRDRYVSTELQLELYKILNDIRHIDYMLKIFKKSSISDFYTLDNFGYIDLFNIQGEWNFQEDNGYKISFLDFDITESYFKLNSADIFRKYEIYGSVS
jgi:hypothetical protein